MEFRTYTEKSDNVIEVLRVVGAFGIKGQLRAVLFSDNICAYKKVYTSDGCEFDFRVIRFVGGKHIIISLSGINDRTEALSFKGAILYVKKSDLEQTNENEYYVCDLIGKNVKIIDHEDISCKVVNVFNFGAGDLIEISYQDATFMVPFKKENFPSNEHEEEILMTFDAFTCYKD